MLLLASELLAIELCVGSARSELGPFDVSDGLILDKQYGGRRHASDCGGVSDVALLCVCGPGTLIGKLSLCTCTGAQKWATRAAPGAQNVQAE